MVSLSFYTEGHQGFAAVHLILIFSCEEIEFISSQHREQQDAACTSPPVH